MLRFYFKKPVSVHKNKAEYPVIGRRFYNHSYRRMNYWKLIYALWFWMFLEFATKIGFLSVAPRMDLGKIYASQYSAGINIPAARNLQKVFYSRHTAFLSIDKSGIIKLDGHI